MTAGTCTLDGCDGEFVARGYCDRHYRRWRRENPGQSGWGTAEQRFWRSANQADGCWLWSGWIDAYGYGGLSVEGKQMKAHRYAYELLVGPIPDGLSIDHLCRVRSCVNPAHMEPVTRGENVRRGNAPAHVKRRAREAENEVLIPAA